MESPAEGLVPHSGTQTHPLRTLPKASQPPLGSPPSLTEPANPIPSGTHQSLPDGAPEDDQSSSALTSSLTEANNLSTVDTGTPAHPVRSTSPNQGSPTRPTESTHQQSVPAGSNNTNNQLQPTTPSTGTYPHTNGPTWARVATTQLSSGTRSHNNPSAAPPRTTKVRGIVVRWGGNGKNHWVQLHSPAYPRRLFVFRGELTWKSRAGASITFTPLSTTTTIGNIEHFTATKPTLCTSTRTTEPYAWYPGTFTVAKGEGRIEFTFPNGDRACSTRAHMLKSHFTVPTSWRRSFRPGTAVLFQATVGANGTIEILPRGLRHDVNSLRQSVPCQLDPATVAKLGRDSLVIGGLVAGDVRNTRVLPQQATLEHVLSTCGSLSKFDLLQAAYTAPC